MVPTAYPTIMDLMRAGRVDAVQIPYNVVNRGVEAEILPLAEELGIGILVMEPLQKGRYVNELREQPDLTPLAEYGIHTWAQALLAWIVSDKRVSSAIPTTSRPERISENAQAGSAAPCPRNCATTSGPKRNDACRQGMALCPAIEKRQVEMKCPEVTS